MAGRTIDNWAISDANWTQEIESKNILKRGWFNLEFTNLDATTESEIGAGSSVDIDGIICVFDSLESITGTEATGVNYIRVYESGGSVYAEYTTTEPEWNQEKRGYYDSATGLRRYIMVFEYAGSEYVKKRIMNQRNSYNEFNENESFIVVDDDYTVPADTVRKKEIFIDEVDDLKSITLPDVSNINTELEISGRDAFRVIQPQSENLIKYRDDYFTAKGVTGYLELERGDFVRMMYVGEDLRTSEPGTKLSAPASLPSSAGLGVHFSHDGAFLAVVNALTPYITIYSISGDTFTKLSDPATLPASNAGGVKFSDDGVYLAIGHDASPYITIYKRSGTTFTKLSNPATLPTGNGNSVDFSDDGVYLAIGHDASPYITIYKRSGDTFTKLSNPATLPPGNVTEARFSSSGTYLAATTATSPYITIYKRSGDTFTKLSDPSTLPAHWGDSVDFSRDESYLAVGHNLSPFITIYKRSGDTFTKLSNPATLPPGRSYGVSFSRDGKYLIAVGLVSPYIIVYKRSGDTFTKLSDPSTLPAGGGRAVDFSLGAKFYAIGASTDNVCIYKLKETCDKTWQVLSLHSQISPISGIFK